MKKPPANPVKADDKFRFSQRIAYWQRQLNLADWRIVLSLKRAPAHAVAIVDKCSLPDRLATIKLGGDFGSMAVNGITLDQMALHEVAHIWLAEYSHVCQDPRSTDDDIMAAEHRLVNSLVSMLIED